MYTTLNIIDEYQSKSNESKKETGHEAKNLEDVMANENTSPSHKQDVVTSSLKADSASIAPSSSSPEPNKVVDYLKLKMIEPVNKWDGKY